MDRNSSKPPDYQQLDLTDGRVELRPTTVDGRPYVEAVDINSDPPAVLSVSPVEKAGGLRMGQDLRLIHDAVRSIRQKTGL